MNLRPSGYEPDELPGCSTPRKGEARGDDPAVYLFVIVKRPVLGWPGSDLLSQVLRLSTIGAEEFNGRVRDGIGLGPLARTTRPAKDRKQAGQTIGDPPIMGIE